MLPAGIRRLFRFGSARDIERDLDAELAFHFEAKTRALIAAGMSEAAAREEALRLFGDLRVARAELLRADQRDVTTRQRREWRGDWWIDIRHAARSLRRTPGMTLTVVFLLALGIGANAAMLGILDRLLLRPPPHLADPAHLVRIGVTSTMYGVGEYTNVMGTYPDIGDYARGIPELSSVAGYQMPRAVPVGTDSAAEAKHSIVTGAYFPTLGAHAALGRVFDSTAAAGPPIVVIGDAFWRRQFGGDPAALGRTLVLDGRTYTVVGVMPRGFTGAEVDAADAWTLLEHSGLNASWYSRDVIAFQLIARLRNGADPVAAGGRIGAIRAATGAARSYTPLRREAPPETGRLVSIVPGRVRLSYAVDLRLSLAVAAVSLLLLLITIANVAHVLMVRAIARQREFALRVALGAGWARLLRLVLAESLIVALLGGLLAAGVGAAAGYRLRALLLPNTSWAEPPLSPFTGLVAGLLALLIGVVTGLVPAALARREDALGALRSGVQSGRGWRGGVRGPLVAFQVAVSVVLLAGAGLFVRSLVHVGTTDHGLDLRHMVSAPVDLTGDGAARRQQLDDILSDLRRIPGVTHATAAMSAPYRGYGNTDVRGDGSDSALGVEAIWADAGFLTATGLRLVAGRDFTRDDRIGAEPVVVVNETLAARFWPKNSAMGRCLYLGRANECHRVVGIAVQARYVQLRDEPDPQFYIPMNQMYERGMFSFFAELYVRTSGDPEALVDPVRRMVARHIPGYPARVKSFVTLMGRDVRPWRVGVLLFCTAAALALALSIVGLYAVMAFAVKQRAHEFGVRRALGAPGVHLARLAVQRGLLITFAGVTVGTAAVFGVAQTLAPMLFETNPRDPSVLVAAALAVFAAASAASLFPTLAALRVDPRQALQAD